MLHVRSVAGESLATIELASFSATLTAGISPVLALKQHLHSLCGQPRFRQQLVFFHDGVVANVSDEHMLRQGEAQLVLVPFSPASEKQVKELRDAAGSGLASTVEAILQRPQDPDLGQPTPLLVACAHGHLEVVELLLEARADPHRATNDGITPLFLGGNLGNFLNILL